jgi:hypothetical protein
VNNSGSSRAQIRATLRGDRPPGANNVMSRNS